MACNQHKEAHKPKVRVENIKEPIHHVYNAKDKEYQILFVSARTKSFPLSPNK